MATNRVNTYTPVSGKIIKETDAAVLFKVAGNPSHWFPLSQINEIHRDVGNGGEEGEDMIVVADWILIRKGITS